MKKSLYFLLFLAFSQVLTSPTLAQVTFVDIPVGYWAYDFITEIHTAQITAGCSQSPLKFCPEDYVTREQMAAFIVRSMEREPPLGYCGSEAPFPDVTADMWSCRFIKSLKELGITAGYPDGRFGPYDWVNREQMATFLVKAIEGLPPAAYCNAGDPFSDVTSAMWSCGFIKRLKEMGITAGYPGGGFGPYDTVTRAQMAASSRGDSCGSLN